MTTKPKTFNDVLIEEIKDLYSAETQLIKALPHMGKAAHDRHLKAAIGEHLEQTKQQADRLREAADLLGISPTGKTCQAMRGLLEEAEERLHGDKPGLTRDVSIIGVARKVEHYEIAGYTSARNYAQLLGHHRVAELLQTTLDEEATAERNLGGIGEVINSRAQFREDMRMAC